IHPPQLGADSESNLMQKSWSTFKKEEGAWARHAELLIKKSKETDAKDVRWRQLYQFGYQSGELWSYSPGEGDRALGWVNRQLGELLKYAPFAAVHKCKLVKQVLGNTLLPELARMLFATGEEIVRQLEDEQNKTFETITVGDGSQQLFCEPLKVLPLLAVAGRMALDPRRLHDAVTEHIGLAADFDLPAIHQLIADCEWPIPKARNDGEVHFRLTLECPHQTMDFALEHCVKELTMLGHAARQWASASPVSALFFDDKGVQARRFQGMANYSRPHVRFGLDERKTMQLLMGQKLYGDPQLALRELYQNSLDACRYREARVKYLSKIGKKVNKFVGKISFKAGKEEGTGRPYIECSDNGIGMTKKHLSRLFARGGSRFAESHDFQVERAQWKLEGIEFYPNSRFGVGVLSYFMLADQIDVETSRLKDGGNSREPMLKVTIEGSNSIFRVRKELDDPHLEEGTAIRLYLRDDKTDPDEVLASVKKWLALPEFEVQIEYINHQRNTLAAGEYCYSEDDKARNLELIPIPESARENGQARLYWALAYERSQWENQ
ncbi:MAG: hypothetical protein MJK04_18690, partial [Psychrosphaera sp.]|nr:hypothetical protein [Psychrosphaera sp.]